MKTYLLKAICSLQGLVGLAILLVLPWALAVGAIDGAGENAIALKVATSLVRAAFLVACLVAAWKAPRYAALFAFCAFLAYVVGASADVVSKYGVVDAWSKLILPFYVTASAHAVAALLIWLLARSQNQRASG